jgi:hypothetical protein
MTQNNDKALEETGNENPKPTKNVAPTKPTSSKSTKAKTAKTTSGKKVIVKNTKRGKPAAGSTSNYPRHPIDKALRIPKAILEQNAGKECTKNDAAKFIGLAKSHGPFDVEVSSALKYGFLERPSPNVLKPTDLAKQILRPQASDDELNGYRQAVLNAPVISDVYKHYRGENLPDAKFFSNALTESFKIPAEKILEFTEIFIESLDTAKLTEKIGEKRRILDIATEGTSVIVDTAGEFRKLIKTAGITSGDSCFVMMPFAAPLGDYYLKIYEPAIRKAGLNPLRADNDIFGTGKIIDQIWSGINSSKVLIAELTSRNPNVFYELGLAHAIKKPVVLVCSNEDDVPFDLKHIRVIYYDMHDPFWGAKLIEKIAENILSAISNPDEAILFK